MLSNCYGIRDDNTFIVCQNQNVKFILEQNMKAKREGSIFSVPLGLIHSMRHDSC
jgi:hypothetical protein